MAKQELKTTIMPGETEQKYTAWLLYCETGSIDKLLNAWDRVGQMADEIGIGFAEKLGKKPARSTIGEWAKKFQWVERRDLKLAEDLEAMRERSKKIAREKKHKVLELFDRVINQVRKQLKERIEAGGQLTIAEVKQAWEMATIEQGKPISRTALEEKQAPLTPEEKERGKKIDEAIKEILTRKQGRRSQRSPLDTDKQHKKRKRRAD